MKLSDHIDIFDNLNSLQKLKGFIQRKFLGLFFQGFPNILLDRLIILE